MARDGRLARGLLNVSVVLVHYHTPALVEESLAALAADAAAAALDLECVLVDNGSTEAAHRDLRQLSCRYLRATDDAGQPTNLGYAGGANLGVAASTGDVIVVMNPDVIVQSGCLAALCEALRAGADVAGPRFFLDRACRVLQPPADQRTRWQDLRTVLAQAGIGARFARRAWRRTAQRFWTATTALPSTQLSGAMLALRRSVWEQIGPFDTGYQLYFEETDWLARLRYRGGRAVLAPAATAVHLFAQSTLAEPRSSAWFENSAGRYRRQWYGRLHTAVVEGLSGALERRRQAWQRRSVPLRPVSRDQPTLAALEGACWLELSLDRCGFPAAAVALDPPSLDRRSFDLTRDLGTQLADGNYTLRWVDRAGRDLGVRQVVVQNRSESPMV